MLHTVGSYLMAAFGVICTMSMALTAILQWAEEEEELNNQVRIVSPYDPAIRQIPPPHPPTPPPAPHLCPPLRPLLLLTELG